MSTLRELSTELMEVRDLALNPEIPAEALRDTLDGIEGMFNEKAVSVVHVIANNDSDISEVDAEIKRLQDRKKVMVNARARLKDYLLFNMQASDITKISSPLFNITLAAPRDIVVIDDVDSLADDYKRVTIAPDKVLIGKALKDGYKVAGAHMEKGKSSVRIK